MIRVNLSGQLRDWTKGAGKVELDAEGDLGTVVKKLDAVFPGIVHNILDDQDRIRTHVNVFVNSENARDLGRERTELRDGDVVHILPSVAGG